MSHNWIADQEWKWFDGLKQLGKPGYMIVLDGRANDGHLLGQAVGPAGFIR